MWDAGLVDEVRDLEKRGLRDGLTAGRALGYAQVLRFLAGEWTQEQAKEDTIRTTRRFARAGRIAYVHFRNVRGKVPHYEETFVDNGDVDMAEIVRILREEEFDGIMVPDHVPEVLSKAPWHAGMAYTIGYMRALIIHAQLLGPSTGARSNPNAAVGETV